uniref:MULE transposase domain-containing protein n=1 Tax=Meloidogyne javanica TaxID=6303 RepID=A0A915N6W6_MELJA
MADKSENTYIRALHVLFEALNGIGPLSVMLDFEQATKNAYLNVFGDAIQIRFCPFHLGQSILRKIQKSKLTHVYTTNDDYKKLVRSLAALSFLRPIQVTPAFNLLRQKAQELYIAPIQNGGDPMTIFDYFARENGGAPLFPIEMWNHHESILVDLGRTNNAQEGFHLALRKQFSSAHPPLSKLVNVLKNEERIAKDKIYMFEILLWESELDLEKEHILIMTGQ